MFKLQPEPLFWSPVSIYVPAAAAEAIIDVQFKHKTRSQLAEFLKFPEGTTDLAAIREIVADWKGLDQDFSAANLEALLNNYPAAAQALLDAYRAALGVLRRKN